MKFFTYGNFCAAKKARIISWLKGLDPAIKRMIIMRINLVAFFISITIMNVCASVHAQSLNLTFKEAAITEVLAAIKKQSGYQFLYNETEIKRAKPVSIAIKNGDLKEALDQVFKDQPLNYQILDKTIVVKEKKGNDSKAKSVAIEITGKVVDKNNLPISGVTVKVKGTDIVRVTGSDGLFNISLLRSSATLFVSFVGYKTKELTVDASIGDLIIVLDEETAALQEVNVVSTGYQNIPKERATGSFVQISNEMLNRRVSPNIIERLEGITSGLLLNRNSTNEPSVSIRGQSTIFGNSAPLVVLDGFPYEGNLSSINPNDIQDVTILKDAAAASIWGVRSGNGVIVINSKKGVIGKPVQIDFNGNLTVGAKPDVKYQPALSSESFIGMERKLFAAGFYNADINNTTTRPPLTPVVETLLAQRNNLISETEANSIIGSYINKDSREDFERYFQRNSRYQQYSVSMRGATPILRYFLSTGYDDNLENLVGNDRKRVSLRSENVISPVKDLQVTVGMMYVNNKANLDNPGLQVLYNPAKRLYPYASLADESGNPLPISFGYRGSFIDDAATKGLLDWKYRPLAELRNADNSNTENYIKLNSGVKYKVMEGLNAEVLYQFEKSFLNDSQFNNVQSYFTRDLINKYTSIDGNGNIIRPIPLGGILDHSATRLHSQTGRFQLNYDKLLSNGGGRLAAIAGIELKETKLLSERYRLYGYDDKSLISKAVDYANTYKQYDNPARALLIPNRAAIVQNTVNRFRSYFLNASYTLEDKYTLSGSARVDASNLFGVDANKRSVPLWSTGLSWNLAKETFLENSAIPMLRLRATYGFNGNIDKSVTAFVTASRTVNPYTNLPMETIINPANPNLRWEKIGILNIGVDFASPNSIVSGSVEFYHKKGKDLLGFRELDETSGLLRYKGNVASIRGNGVDVMLKSMNLKGAFNWTSDYLFSHTTDKVSSVGFGNITALVLVQQQAAVVGSRVGIVPLQGNPVYGIYSYKSAALDEATGNPKGYVNGVESMNYSTIINAPSSDDLVFSGSARPTYFGGLRNTFGWNKLSVSANVTYKLGYVFRRSSVNYDNLYRYWEGNEDFDRRWQKPGDEKSTNVPSMPSGYNSARSTFYAYSSALISDASHIRFQDVSISYDLTSYVKRANLKALSVYLYADNVGIIWRANKFGIDPDYVPSANSIFLPLPRSVSLGIRATL